MLMKVATHVVAMGLGAAAGIYWGVNHPSQAQTIHDTELQDAVRVKAAIAQGQQQFLQKTSALQSTALGSSSTTSASNDIQTGKQDLNAAK